MGANNFCFRDQAYCNSKKNNYSLDNLLATGKKTPAPDILCGSLCRAFMIQLINKGNCDSTQPFREDIPARMISSTRRILVAITVQE